MHVMACALLIAALTSGCKKSDKPAGGEGTGDQAPLPLDQKLTADARRGPGFSITAKPLVVEAKPGPAYVYVANVGLVTFEAGEAKLTRLPLGRVDDIEIAADGTIYLDEMHVYRYRDGAAEKFGGEAPPEAGTTSDIALASDGTLWLADFRTIHKWDGKTWTSYENILPAELSFQALTIDADGKVFATANKAIAAFDGKEWKIVYNADTPDIPSDNHPSFVNTIITPGGELVFAHVAGFFRSDGKKLSHHGPESGLGSPVFLVGDELLAFGWDSFNRVTLDGQVKSTPFREVTPSEPLDVDRAGRIWAVTKDGFAVIAADNTVTKWPAGSLAAITGDVTAVRVVGTGPDKLPAAGEIATGTIKGVVTSAGQPVAQTDILLCQLTRLEYTRDTSPCADDKPLTGKTDDQGAFSIQAPLRAYEILVEHQDQWYKLMGSQCAGMNAGDACDLKQLELTAKWP